MFTRIFFKCIACEEDSPLFQSFPLCERCKNALIPCPSLCEQCASPACPDHRCLHPWNSHQLINSYSSAYLLLSDCYRVLKKWKTRRGLLFDRQVLNYTPSPRDLQAQAVIPMPQNIKRSWLLGGSPAEVISSQIARELKIPVLKCLLPPMRTLSRQAELSAEDRIKNSLEFKPSSRFAQLPRGATVILVDDFMTTGHTLRKAAYTLKAGGVGQIHAYCLGIRLPLRKKTELMPDLMKGT